MTGRARSRASLIARRLHGRHLLERELDAEVAAGDHDPVERVHDVREELHRLRLLDLGDERDPGPAGVGHDLPRELGVVGAADEGHRDDVRAGGQRPAQVGLVLLGQRGRADVDARQVDALVVGDLPADHDPQVHPAAAHAGDVELDVAVVDQDAVADPHVIGQALVGGGRLAHVTGDVLGGDRELLARDEPDRPVGEHAEADLRPLQVGEDADGPAGHVRARPYPVVNGQVVGLRAVAHVEPGDVHAGADQRGDLLLAGGRGPKGADDLRTAAHRGSPSGGLYHLSRSWAWVIGVTEGSRFGRTIAVRKERICREVHIHHTERTVAPV